MKAKQMKAEERVQVDETARLFESSLAPLFGVISANSERHVMDKLSLSLRKALLLMAMQRYSSDPAAVCRALGISAEKLNKELRRCGLPGREKKAA
jgi:DNA-binding NtrC family response regulator